MKLLIADDEKLTREGIRSHLDLEGLGISQVFLADDGIHGLKLALDQRPDIVLTDVRMPRMNGVVMAERILEQLPDTVIVFMSAYSDKEYLKAAIKLKAVSYVEKPLDMAELREALSAAAEDCRKKKAGATARQLREKTLMNRLVTLLTGPDGDAEKLSTLLSQIEPPLGEDTWAAVTILDFAEPLSGAAEAAMRPVSMAYEAFLKEQGLRRLTSLRADRYLISLLTAPEKLGRETLLSCASYIREQVAEILPRFFLAVGPAVWGLKKVRLSYLEAEELLEGSFFHEYGSILTRREPGDGVAPGADLFLSFSSALTGKNETQAHEAVQELYLSLCSASPLLPDQIRDLYYRYLGKLEEVSLENHLLLWQREDGGSDSIWEGVRDCSILAELHRLLEKKVSRYFEALKENSSENPLIFQVKDFIHHNYQNPALSVPDVSACVRLSPSYVCTLFKNETGQTLNQYLTDYRIKMSKQLLGDPRYKITDISSRVGYSDGNYYSRSFKKLVGLSPSEYREKMLS